MAKKSQNKWYLYRNPDTGAEVKRIHPFDGVRLAVKDFILYNVVDLDINEKEKKAK